MKKNAKIFIAGPNGMVGSAIIRRLEKKGFSNLLRPSHTEIIHYQLKAPSNKRQKHIYLSLF